jgi:hypothetical protein
MRKKPQPPVVDEWSGVNEQSGWDWEKPSIQAGRSSSEEAYLKEIRDELRRLRKRTQPKPETAWNTFWDFIKAVLLVVVVLFVVGVIYNTWYYNTWGQWAFALKMILGFVLIGLFAPPVYRRW